MPFARRRPWRGCGFRAGDLGIVAAANADFFAPLAVQFGIVHLFDGEVERPAYVVVVLLAVALDGRFQFAPIQKREQILFFFLVVDVDLQHILVGNIDAVIESLFTVVFHRRQNAAQNVFGPDIVARPAEQPLVPRAKRAIDFLKQIHRVVSCAEKSVAKGRRTANEIGFALSHYSV